MQNSTLPLYPIPILPSSTRTVSSRDQNVSLPHILLAKQKDGRGTWCATDPAHLAAAPPKYADALAPCNSEAMWNMTEIHLKHSPWGTYIYIHIGLKVNQEEKGNRQLKCHWHEKVHIVLSVVPCRVRFTNGKLLHSGQQVSCTEQ